MPWCLFCFLSVGFEHVGKKYYQPLTTASLPSKVVLHMPATHLLLPFLTLYWTTVLLSILHILSPANKTKFPRQDIGRGGPAFLNLPAFGSCSISNSHHRVSSTGSPCSRDVHHYQGPVQTADPDFYNKGKRRVSSIDCKQEQKETPSAGLDLEVLTLSEQTDSPILVFSLEGIRNTDIQPRMPPLKDDNSNINHDDISHFDS